MNLFDSILGIIAPYDCLQCGAQGSAWCKACLLTYPTLPSICYICARATKDHMPCNEHSTKYTPHNIFIAGDYSDSLQAVIRAYKFDYWRAAAHSLAQYLDTAVPYIAKDTIVTYVPATGNHVRERGFNHVKNISKVFAHMRHLPHHSTLLRVSYATQKGANRETRMQQLQNAFMPLPGVAHGKNVLLIDDVVTTGATIQECTKQLYKTGANSVQVAVIARTPK